MEEVNRWHLENFNPRSREGSDDEDHGCERQGVVDFNPRSREGSDRMVLTILGAINISIHAPVKGATSPCLSLSNPLQYFNPRSREGSDVPSRAAARPPACISIHAPVKGATVWC